MRLGLVLCMALVVLGAAGATSYADPPPTYDTPQSLGLAWGEQDDIGYNAGSEAVDVADGVVWSASSAEAENGSGGYAVLQRTTTSGEDLGRLAEPASGPANGHASWGLAWSNIEGVSAGPWGAVVAGSTNGVFPGSDSTAPEQGYDTVVQRFAPDGTVMWTSQVDINDGDMYVSGVAVSGDTIVVAGYGSYGTTGDVDGFLVDTFSLTTGAELASREIGSTSNDYTRAVTVDGDEVIVGGFTDGSMGSNPASGGDDGVVVALNIDDLSTRWITDLGTAGDDLVDALTSRDGTVYWGGMWDGNFDLTPNAAGAVGAISSDGTPLWQDSVDAPAADVRGITTTSRGIVLGGQVTPSGMFPVEAYLEGRDFDGTSQWHLALAGGGDYDIINSVAATPDQVYFGGTTYDGMFGPVGTDGSEALLGALDVATVLNPDLQVSPPPTNAHVTPAHQSINLVVHRGRSTTRIVRIHNDGLVRDTISLRGCTEAGLAMAWHVGNRNVSAHVRNGTYRTPRLIAGESQRLRWHIKAGHRARLGTVTCLLVARSTHDAKAVDKRTVKLVVKRAR